MFTKYSCNKKWNKFESIFVYLILILLDAETFYNPILKTVTFVHILSVKK